MGILQMTAAFVFQNMGVWRTTTDALRAHTSSELFSSQFRSSKVSRMRMSCNGCRVLRKGCSKGCSIRPCLQWMRSSKAQSYATMFLAKFYGRAGLINLIGSGPEHLRHVIFQSLLFEACGRIVNPIHGSVGLMCSGQSHLCEEAVQSVLSGSPINATSSFKPYDIHHVSKEHGILACRARFKRSGHRATGSTEPVADSVESDETIDQAEHEVEEGFGLDLKLSLAPPGAHAD